MSYGLAEQREYIMNRWSFGLNPNKSWRKKRRSAETRFLKISKNRVERRRAKQDPECPPMYGRFRGYEW